MRVHITDDFSIFGGSWETVDSIDPDSQGKRNPGEVLEYYDGDRYLETWEWNSDTWFYERKVDIGGTIGNIIGSIFGA